MLVIILTALYLAISLRYYEYSTDYPEAFKCEYEERQGCEMTGAQLFILGACYIYTCFLWPIYGAGLKKYWK